MIRRMMRMVIDAIGYREGFRRGYIRGKRQSELAAQVAHNAAIDTGYDKGYEAGLEAGESEGKAEGKKRGRMEAYVETAIQLGILRPHEQAKLPDLSHVQELQLHNRHPNVYRCHNRWIVRVLHGGERHRRAFDFPHNSRQYMTVALVDAIRWRDQFDAGDRLRHVFEEVVNTVCEPGATGIGVSIFDRQGTLDVALEFHRRMLVNDITLDHAGWVGDDPEDRLHARDTGFLLSPWTEIYTTTGQGIPGPVSTVMPAIGLGDGVEPRTVRDLLLVTADELTAVYGFGEKSLRKLRMKLGEHGLALWGEDPPAQRDPEYNRHRRGLVFEEP